MPKHKVTRVDADNIDPNTVVPVKGSLEETANGIILQSPNLLDNLIISTGAIVAIT